MFTHNFKLTLKSVFVLLVGFIFSSIASASSYGKYGEIIENNTIGTAHHIGSWKYHSSLFSKLEKGKNTAYFTFTANKGDRVYVQTSYAQEGLKIEVLDSYLTQLDKSENVIKGLYDEFIFAKADSDRNYQRFYIRVTRTNSNIDTYYSIHINKRISTGIQTFSFDGTASNSGNYSVLYNPQGVDSSEITMDLRNNSKIPPHSIVKSIETKGYLSKNLGGVLHKVYSEDKDKWYTAIVKGTYGIDSSEELDVAQKWKFKYNFKGTASSTMSRVKATIHYEYDITDQFIKR